MTRFKKKQSANNHQITSEYLNNHIAGLFVLASKQASKKPAISPMLPRVGKPLLNFTIIIAERKEDPPVEGAPRLTIRGTITWDPGKQRKIIDSTVRGAGICDERVPRRVQGSKV